MSLVVSHGQSLAKVSLGQPLPTTTHRRHTFGKKRIPVRRRRVVLHHALRVQSQAGFGRGTVKIKEEEIDVEVESEPSTGTKKFMKLPGTVKLPGEAKSQAKGQSQPKSNKVVFVAGATGKVGSRTVRELLKLGFQVRAGTRNAEKAQALFEDATQGGQPTTGSDDRTPFFSPAKLFSFLKPKAGKTLEIVECDLEDAESIEPALGNAGVIVCCIGASEKEVLDVSGPYRIDFKATANLINAASSAQVNHFVLLTSLGTQKFGFPAAVLNLFWGVLVWKAKAEKALLQSGLPYTIVRPGGMERPTDAYKETHNLLLAEADKLFGGQVSNLQVAELLASIVENPDVSVNKIIEAVAETTAPLRPIRELLEEIPVQDGTVSSTEPERIRKSRPAKTDENIAKEKRALALKEKEEKRFQAEKLAEEKLAKAQKEKEEKRIQAENDEKERLRLQALRKKYEEEIEAARKKEEAANSAAAAALAEKAELEKRAAEVRAKAEAAALAASQAKAVEAAVLAAARKGTVLSDADKEKIIESVKLARLPKEDTSKESKPSPKKKPTFSFFGKATPSTETATGVESPKDTKEDQAKLDVESKAKAKAEQEAAEKLAEKKKQEEKAILEAKKKAEQDKLEKEAKQQAEKEAAEAQKKKEAEAKRKEEEAEARRKEEEAEAKRKEEEAETRRKEEEAEAKKKEEQERAEKEAERLKVEAEKKAKALAQKEAEAKRKEEELAKAKKKEEQEKAEKEAERLEVEAEQKAKALAEQEAAAKALAEQEAAAAAAAAAAEAEKKKEELRKAEEAPAPRRQGFRWFWQPAEPDPSVPVQAEATEQLPHSSKPLSPYTRYPGLKPPRPPIASPPTAKAKKVDTPKIEPVSPVINRVEQTTEGVGLLAEKGNEVVAEEVCSESQEDIEARAQQAKETAAREREALEKAKAAVSFKWLWEKTDPVEDYSASTSSKKEDSVSSSEKEDPPSPVKEQVAPASKSDDLPRSSRPLSPYAQFPNLKPPAPPRASSPMPSSLEKEFQKVEALPNSSKPLSPYPGFPDLKPPPSPTPPCNEVVNGALPEREKETEEKKDEAAFSFGFKWPWQQ